MSNEPENIREFYREMILRLRRVKRICNRARKNLKVNDRIISKQHLKASELKMMDRDMPIITEFVARKIMDEKSNDFFAVLVMNFCFSLKFELIVYNRSSEEYTWWALLGSRYKWSTSKADELMDEFWEIMELPPERYSGRMMLFKLRCQ